MPGVLRPAEDRDDAAVAAIASAIAPGRPECAGKWRQDASLIGEEEDARRRYVAADAATGEVIGYGSIRPEPGLFDPRAFRRYRLELLVAPARQRRGIGGALLARLEDDLRALGASAVRARVPDDRPAALGFARTRGFEPFQRMWRLRLAVATAPDDPATVETLEARLVDRGVVIATLAEERERAPDCLRKLLDLENESDADIPSGEPFRPKSLEEFAQWLERMRPLDDAFFLARHGDRYVGESWLARDDLNPGNLRQGMTGVRRAWRRGGLATALKLRTITYARRHGYRTITTSTLDTNVGMLAVNERLGFRRQGSEYRLEKALVGNAERGVRSAE